jgi:hypothetical protein
MAGVLLLKLALMGYGAASCAGRFFWDLEKSFYTTHYV